MQGLKRTHMCGHLSARDSDSSVVVTGWVQRRRDLGGLIFLDIRDRTGIIQVVADGEVSEEAFETAGVLRNEFVVGIKGTVVMRKEDAINPKLKTGEVEVTAEAIEIFSKAQTPPIYIEDNSNITEALRLKYRYLDLRRPAMQKNLMLRHRVTMGVRRFLDQNGFLEIETPMLTKPTPEGARDYLVPSRVNPGRFFALPQSPQLFKQLLMASGVDKYFQIARCFRDEDLRADRQPEFTQIDIEMSFVDMDDIISLNEKLMAYIFEENLSVKLEMPFKRMTYKQAMEDYGSDKPDTRFEMKLICIKDIVAGSSFRVFSDTADKGGDIRGINAKGCGDSLSRREIDALVEYVRQFGAKGLAWIAVTTEGVKSPIAKFLSPEETGAIVKRMDGKPGDLLLIVADRPGVVFDSLGGLRLHLGKKLGLIDHDAFNFLWVTHFPLLEYDNEERRYVAVHHPFTSPVKEDISLLDNHPGKVRANAYDLVLNGMELGGGSIRIHDTKMQQKMFEVLGFTQQKAEEKFGFLLEAFKYGAPPHGGIAFGLDRLVMLVAGKENIRDVIAFPKTQNAACLMTGAPAEADGEQLKEIHIKLDLE
ncbi:MAG: aspartate--tRNA ligase [Bacillota bacterium]|nr:aspartate--tRNA ligase [Bacillota bacterium]MDD3851843.1 aspartate--tRNA ligase [Bacillota bacterium]MDD4707893.1 aspartate--tRNA ligase [Bacillota bacterium]